MKVDEIKVDTLYAGPSGRSETRRYVLGIDAGKGGELIVRFGTRYKSNDRRREQKVREMPLEDFASWARRRVPTRV